MAFTGGRSFGTPAIQTGYELEERKRADDWSRAMDEARQSFQMSQAWAQSVRDNEARQARQQESEQRALMTPGVSRGISSGRSYSVADSPMMRSSSKAFRIGDQDFNYDPMAAAEQQAVGQANAEEEANKVRYESLRKIPGIGDRGAARAVYGRAYEDADETERAKLQADYLRNPSREAAARVIEAKGTMQFPSELFTKPHEGELDYREPAPQYGTPEYMAAWREMQGRRSEDSLAAIEARGEQSRMSRAMTPRERLSVDEDGYEYILDMDTLERTYTGGRRPYNPIDAMLRNQMGRSSGPPVEPGVTIRPDGTPVMREGAPRVESGRRLSPAFQRTYGVRDGGDATASAPATPSSGRNAGAWRPMPSDIRAAIDAATGDRKYALIDKARSMGFAYP